MNENKRDDFCKWYYAQPQPLDAHRVFDWFIADTETTECKTCVVTPVCKIIVDKDSCNPKDCPYFEAP